MSSSWANRRPVLAVDPGEDTGIAMWWPADTLDGVSQFSSQELNYREVGLNLDGLIMMTHPIIVAERFDITMETVQKGAPGFSLKVLGMLDYLARRHQCGEVIMQARSKRTVMSDARLKHLGWFKRGLDGHANDAARHLGAYLLDNNLIDGRELVAL